MSRNPRDRCDTRKHTHHHFNHGEVNNGVLMAAAGKYGHYLGEVNLTIENKK